MELRKHTLIVGNIKTSVNASLAEAFSVALSKLRKQGIRATSADCSVYRRSVDARRRDDVSFVYSIAVSVSDPPDKLPDGVTLLCEESPKVVIGDEPLRARPMVVGTGPAGLFAALLLAENGYCPIVIERGGSVDERKSAVDKFNTLHILDPETNIQFGAGGAGTFSDGKLVTRINDPMSSYVMEKLTLFGAPEEIKFMAKPHVGTDVLSAVVDAMLEKIAALGGEVHYNTRLLDFSSSHGSTVAKTSRGDFSVGAIILAIGHSARDTYQTLIAKGMSIEAKAFSVGMRIEHLTENIDKALYGDFAGHPSLGHAEYNLSHNTKERGVYTFCMCPGGEVVAAASEEGGVVVNGMSNSRRDGRNSNSAVVCSIFKENYGATPEKAITFQRNIEQKSFLTGKSTYAAPIITVGDFINGQLKTEPSRVIPTYMNGDNVVLARPSDYLPDIVCGSIKNALLAFDKRIENFASPDAILTGAETRTSAPVRILRDKESFVALGYDNIYPAGEGAGYAGGITSAAIDGVRAALALMKKFKQFNG